MMMNAAQQAYGKSGGLDAAEREQLLLEQLPQVRYIAKRIHERLPDHVSLDDLIQAGVLGLIEAMEKYDPAKNVQLKSYAKFRIRGAILDSLRDLDWSPRSLRREARRIEAAQTTLRDRLGRMPTEQEVADELELEINEYQKLLGEIKGLDVGSLFVESTEEGGDESMERDVPDTAEKDPFHLCMQTEQRDVLAAAISELSEREQQVLSLYYFEELTMKEVGAVLGVVESRVSQIHTAALIALRGRLKSKLAIAEKPKAMAATATSGAARNRAAK